MPGHCKICEQWPHHNPGCPNEKKPNKGAKKILRKKLAEAEEKLRSQKAQYVADRKSAAKASAEMREVIIRQRAELRLDATDLESEWQHVEMLPGPNCVVLAKVQLQGVCDTTDWGGEPAYTGHKILKWKPWPSNAGAAHAIGARRPMSEAPQDGTSILLRNYAGSVYVCAFRVGGRDEPQSTTAGPRWRTSCCGKFVTPTCWYELPKDEEE